MVSTPGLPCDPPRVLGMALGSRLELEEASDQSTKQVSSAELGDTSWAGSSGKQVFDNDWVKICQFIFPIFKLSPV